MKISIFKLSGKIVSEPELLKAVMLQIALWQKQTSHFPVIVHGGGIYCDHWSEVWQLPSEKVDGLRVTTEQQIPVIAGALAGYAHMQVVAASKTAGLNPVGLTPTTAKTLLCELHPQHNILGRVGQVFPRDPTLVIRLIEQGYLPVFHSLAVDDAGECLNVNADDIATALSIALKAAELILLSDVDGVINNEGKVIEKISEETLQVLVKDPVVSEGMKAKLSSLLSLSWESLERVVITSGKHPDTLPQRLSGQLPATEIQYQSCLQA